MESFRHVSSFTIDKKSLLSQQSRSRRAGDRFTILEVVMSLEPTETNTRNTTAIQILAPDTGPLRRHTHTYDLMRQCIHCGFCLPTCPTYAVLGVEMDSPRGRIYQMQAVADGRLEVSDDFIEHINCCVGCRACETACPSGVQFGKLIEAAREQIQLTPTASAVPASHAPSAPSHS